MTKTRLPVLATMLMIPVLAGTVGHAMAGAMVTDRPTRTDAPYPVPAEHFQIEMDALTFGHFSSAGTEIDDFAVAPLNLKYGFTNRVDVQILITPFERTSVKENGAKSTDDGFGPIGMRFKINIAGNEGTGTAVALLPYVVAPTRGIDKLDNTVYGLNIPVAFPLENGRAIGAAAGMEQIGGNNTLGRVSVLFSTPIAGGWSGALELYGSADGFDDADEQIVTLDLVGVFAPRDDFALDLGLYYGITSDAEDWRVFAGLSAFK